MNPILTARRRAHLAAFWIVMTALAAMIAGGVALAMDLSWPVLWGLGTGVLAVAPGLIWRPWLGLGVRTWNRLARESQGRLRLLALRIAFRTVFPLIGGGGGKLRLAPPQGPGEGLGGAWSMWQIREAKDASFSASGVDEGARGWWSQLFGYARRTGNWSLLGLVPLLFALRLMGEGTEDASPPTSTYTLY